jgi:hypothetical protein
MMHEVMGQRAVIYVTARRDARGGNGLGGGTPLHHQRHPTGDRFGIIAKFHAVIAMMGRHLGEPLSQEGDVRRAAHEAHMRHRMDEAAWVVDRALPYEIGPELAGQVELHIDL